MIGLLLASLTAFFKSSSEIVSKHSLLDEVDEYLLSWSLRFFALPPIALGLLVYGIPKIESGFWIALVFSAPAGVAATVLYMKAIQASELSIISPLSGISPVLVLLSSSLIVGEFPSVLGVIGIMATTVGLYLLKIHEVSSGLAEPLRAVFREPGAKYMLGMLLIYALAAPIDKIGVEASSPIFYTFTLHIAQIMFLTPLMINNNSDFRKAIPENKIHLAAIGGLSGLASIAQMTALSYTLVAYVISIKRSGIIISVLAGHFIFNEDNLRERLIGASVIFLGLLMIGLTEAGAG